MSTAAIQALPYKGVFYPRIIAFCCNWCSYAGSDLAGSMRLKYSANIRTIRVMCSGRISPHFIIKAFQDGADGVLVTGCHIGDCHYINANHWTEKRIEKIHKKMEKLGLRPERLQLAWVSAAEGIRFADVMHQMEKLRHGVTAREVEDTIKALRT